MPDFDDAAFRRHFGLGAVRYPDRDAASGQDGGTVTVRDTASGQHAAPDAGTASDNYVPDVEPGSADDGPARQ